MTDRNELERIRVDVMEQAVIDSIPRELLTWLEDANEKFRLKGGCPGCGSQRIAVHRGGCPTLKEGID